MMEGTYPLLDESEYPGGVVCYLCDQVIGDGQPYSEHLDEMIGDTFVVMLACVYCEQGTEVAAPNQSP